MVIRKKSLTGTLRPRSEVDAAAASPTGDAVQPASSRRGKPSPSAEDLALSKRTVSRILLAKSLFGR